MCRPVDVVRRPSRRRLTAAVLSACCAPLIGCDGGTVVVDGDGGGVAVRPVMRTPAPADPAPDAGSATSPAGPAADPDARAVVSGRSDETARAATTDRGEAGPDLTARGDVVREGNEPATGGRAVRRTRSADRRRAVLGLPKADRGAPVTAATLVLAAPADAWPGWEAAAVAVLRADAVPGGVAVLDPAFTVDDDDEITPAPVRRRREPAAEEPDDAGPAGRTVAVHLHPVADLAALAGAADWARPGKTDDAARAVAADLDPAALAARAFGAGGSVGRSAVVAVTGLDALDPESTGGGFGAVAGPATHPADAKSAVAAEHLRRLAFAAGPDGDAETPDAPPGPPSAGGWEVRLVRFAEPGPARAGAGENGVEPAAAGPHFLVAAPVADPAAFARRLARDLPGVTLAVPPPAGDAGTAGESGNAGGAENANGTEDAGGAEEAGGVEEANAGGEWSEFLTAGSPAPDRAGARAPAGTRAAGPAAVFPAAATDAAAALADPAALPAPCAGDAAAFAGTLASRRRLRDAALAAGGHDRTLWEQGQSSPDRTPRPGEDDLTWALRVVADGCEDPDARGEAYGLLAAADPAGSPGAGSPPGTAGSSPGVDRGRVSEILVETLPAAQRARDGATHLAAMLRWADGPAGLRRVGEAAAAERAPAVGRDLLDLLAAEDASRGTVDPDRLHAVLPLLTALGTGEAAAEYLRGAGPGAAPALLGLLAAEDVKVRRAAVNLLGGPPPLAAGDHRDALLDAARAETDLDLARRLRLLANGL